MTPSRILLALLLATALSVTGSAQYMVADINPGPLSSSSGSELAQLNNTLFWFANDGIHGDELWKSDGTALGTLIVADINPGSAGSIAGASAFHRIAVMGNTLFFAADDGATGRELWKSDGTTAGTVQVMDIFPGSTGSSIEQLTVVGNTLFFAANDPVNGVELWKSDGTTSGTYMVSDVMPGPTTSNPILYIGVGSTLFFAATDGVSGEELWQSDGTAAGTTLVLDISPGPGGSLATTWPTFGALGASIFAVVGNALFFRANDGVHGVELWKSDGTAAGTVLVKDINVGGAGASSSNPLNLVAMGSSLFFRASGVL